MDKKESGWTRIRECRMSGDGKEKRPTFVAAREPDEEETYEEKKDKKSGKPLRLTLFRRQDLPTKENGYQRQQRRLGYRVYHNVALNAQPFVVGGVPDDDL